MNCVFCNAELPEKSSPGRRYCSVKCRRAAERARKRVLNTLVKIKCAACGKEFEARNKTQKYCSTQCRSSARRSLPAWIKPDTKRICPVCGKEFTARCANHRYCSEDCRLMITYPNRKEKKPKPKPALPKNGKPLSEWCREADECNLDYGTYRGLIERGKTFEELRDTADARCIQAHYHSRRWIR